MTTMDTIFLTATLWVGEVLLFTQGILANRDANPSVAANSRNILNDLLRLRPAALAAMAFFLVVWPAVWIAAHLGSR